MKPPSIHAFALCAALAPLAAAGSDIQDAKLNAKLILSEARVLFLRDGNFDGASAQALQKEHGDLRILDDGASTSPEAISIKALGPDIYRIAVFASGYCWGIREQGKGKSLGTLYAKRKSDPKDCKATRFTDTDFVEHGRVW